ncbi:hypothetical protein [[Phormidium] sp. ETS-05]|uniref:hypothetical protein n=1 Tax=[Phormidium] sp. ETS-05 TaxID=222819 RepID=UPI0018EEE0C1|nr:hypothetical protein [[Phormidium] sp. ETS-05]
MDLSVFKNALSAVLVALCGVVGCTNGLPPEPPRTLQIQQTWELKPGDELAGHRIIGGLGDISIALSGDKTLYAPSMVAYNPTPQTAPFSQAKNCPFTSSVYVACKTPIGVKFAAEKSWELRTF